MVGLVSCWTVNGLDQSMVGWVSQWWVGLVIGGLLRLG